MKKIIILRYLCLAIILLFALSGAASGLERGAILYHSSKEDKIYGRDPLLVLPESIGQIAFREMKSGHVGLYIGAVDGKHKIIHAVMAGVEETDSINFITQKDLDEGCRYIGAKVPVNYAAWTSVKKDQLILLAREQVGAQYDVQFRHQKGPRSDGFTCVGLVEYVYEQAGYDITPSGYYKGGTGGLTHTQTYNSELTLWRNWQGLNTFSQTVEFSKFEHPVASTLNVGMIHEGDRYMFFPYTQYLQSTTTGVTTDIPVSGGAGEDNVVNKICFIATAAYGSSLHPHVRILQTFRDRCLLTSEPGRAFVAAYYRYSPSAADFIGRHDFLKAATRALLLPLIGMGYLMLWIGPLPVLAVLGALFLIPLVMALRKQTPM